VLCNLVVRDVEGHAWSVPFAVSPYLREKTVRRLNRDRPPTRRLHYVGKFRLAQGILEPLRRLLPRWVRVYVPFDCGYASKRLLKYIWRQGWHTLCRVPPHRNLERWSSNRAVSAARAKATRYGHEADLRRLKAYAASPRRWVWYPLPEPSGREPALHHLHSPTT